MLCNLLRFNHFPCSWLCIQYCFIADPPNIACSHETCFESRSVKLIAKVYLYDICHPISELFWTVNDEEIDKQGSDGKFSKVSVDFPCLTINNVTRYDAGSYKLTATNAVGSTVSDAIELSMPIIYSVISQDMKFSKNINQYLFRVIHIILSMVPKQIRPFCLQIKENIYFNRYS